ncbi:hypothetical protein FJZ18_02495 [Candidatus Pacearchaeota archaeon]|nr:hypothetical protein [Candidatus Pacearchaeota archaeon]
MERTQINEKAVRALTLSDIERILQIQQEQNILTKDPDIARKEGFLVNLMGKEEIERFLNNGNKFLRVYDNGSGAEGYIAAYTKSCWLEQSGEQLGQYVTGEHQFILKDNYVYLRHIAKKKGVSGRVTIAIESSFYRELSEKGYHYVIGEIATQTPLGISNEVSMRFHRGLGFKKIGERRDNKGYTWAIMCKKLKGGGKNERNDMF